MNIEQIKALVDAGVDVRYFTAMHTSHKVFKNAVGEYWVQLQDQPVAWPLLLCDPAGPFGQFALNGHEASYQPHGIMVGTIDRAGSISEVGRVHTDIMGPYRVVVFDVPEASPLVARVCDCYSSADGSCRDMPDIEEATELAIDYLEEKFAKIDDVPWAQRVKVVV